MANKIINDFIASKGKNLSANGYIRLEDGLIIQWGTRTSGVAATGTTTFGIAFPNACVSVSITDHALATTNLAYYGVNPDTITNSQFTWYTNNATEGGKFFWAAIGY